MEIASQREVEWIEVNPSNMEGILKRIPDRDDLPTEINESLIVELYSK
jgi:small subunit ribosomal protein S4